MQLDRELHGCSSCVKVVWGHTRGCACPHSHQGEGEGEGDRSRHSQLTECSSTQQEHWVGTSASRRHQERGTRECTRSKNPSKP
jgi:hypothetical protein